jgi:hypothetical protein
MLPAIDSTAAPARLLGAPEPQLTLSSATAIAATTTCTRLARLDGVTPR